MNRRIFKGIIPYTQTVAFTVHGKPFVILFTSNSSKPTKEKVQLYLSETYGWHSDDDEMEFVNLVERVNL